MYLFFLDFYNFQRRYDLAKWNEYENIVYGGVSQCTSRSQSSWVELFAAPIILLLKRTNDFLVNSHFHMKQFYVTKWECDSGSHS